MGLSLRAYARHRGVSHTAVQKALRTGRIAALPDGTIDAGAADAAWNLACCGLGSLMPCVDSLWQAIHDAAETLTAQQGQVDPSLWRKTASRTGFVPGLLPTTFPTTNRPTFQQVLELDRRGR